MYLSPLVSYSKGAESTHVVTIDLPVLVAGPLSPPVVP